ncbi:MAG: hypothetical protein J0H40_04135 [Rhizobiales bacterium]|nr:hypothetical protein [Hyphomicrobiales bacterium]
MNEIHRPGLIDLARIGSTFAQLRLIAEKAGAFDLDTVQAGIDKAHQVRGMFDGLKELAEPIFGNPFALPIGIALGILGVLVLIESRRIVGVRLEDHHNAANMGR